MMIKNFGHRVYHNINTHTKRARTRILEYVHGDKDLSRCSFLLGGGGRKSALDRCMLPRRIPKRY
jgi:hypothetical protein